ncbi:hypothetical protein [Desulfotomaculum sp. 1211_IL3151]|uniref:hypothetical protein n=1 Tax=Desulfotomaculum sp. 1211_IL3151 TaxID=3084055 RepID=UPI002FD92ACF
MQSKFEEIKTNIHKLNNLLTVIQGNAELIKLDQQNQEDAAEILDACKQMEEVLRTIRQTISRAVDVNGT